MSCQADGVTTKPALGAQPSLEAFAAARGLADQRQAGQVTALEAAHDRALPEQHRRARPIARQLEAPRGPEALVAESPKPGDPVAAWLNPRLAQRLEAAGIGTLAALVDRINGVGRRWHTGIPALGSGKAQRIVVWLRAHQDSLALSIGSHVGVARSQLDAQALNAVVAPATAIRPLEKFTVPAALDGSRGLHRRPQAECLLAARTDQQAILAWLQAKRGPSPDLHGPLALSNTQRAYRKEAERLLLWAVLQQGKALSSLNPADCAAYRDFLANPQPSSRWCGERARERWSPLWRPFEGPLSASAQRHAVTVLKALCGFLVDQNYLAVNPWSSVDVPQAAVPNLDASRSFSQVQWSFIEGQLLLLPPTSANRRLVVGLHLLYATGLRLSELVAAKVGDLQRLAHPACAPGTPRVQGWVLRLAGSGHRARDVPVPAGVVHALVAYLASRGLAADPDDTDNQRIFLLGLASDAAARAPGLHAGRLAANPRQGIAASTFYNQVKAFFKRCASVLEGQGDAKGAQRFARASTFWMRHSHASHAIAGGMPIQLAQQTLGHASLATMAVYACTDQRQRVAAAHHP